MREQADGEATEANPNTGKQIEGGTTEFYLLLGEDRPQMPIALPLKTEGSEDVDRGRQGRMKTGELGVLARRGGGPRSKANNLFHRDITINRHRLKGG